MCGVCEPVMRFRRRGVLFRLIPFALQIYVFSCAVVAPNAFYAPFRAPRSYICKMNFRTGIFADLFSALGEKLAGFGGSSVQRAVIDRACAANPWFTPSEVVFAVEAIRKRMLQPAALREWLEAYPGCPVALSRRRRVAVIAAGNIPAAGFFDMMCVLVSGHECLLSPSSKDSVLMGYMVELLRGLQPSLPLSYLSDAPDPDAVIASGSDAACRALKAAYGDIPAVLRGSRGSAALLEGDESEQELALLARDIFTYSGLGCRSVGMLLVPSGYDVSRLVSTLAKNATGVNPKYANGCRQARALCVMAGERYADGGFFLLAPGDDISHAVSRINCMEYETRSEAEKWLAEHEHALQCVVSRRPAFARSVRFGEAQTPGPSDWPDGTDLLDFLCGLN